MSTDQNAIPDQAATDSTALSSPVPAPDPATPAAATPTPQQSPAPAPSQVAAAAPALAVGDLATYLLTDADGFETEVSCLVTEVFEHPIPTQSVDANGNPVTVYVDEPHARVIVLPPANVIAAARLNRLG